MANARVNESSDASSSVNVPTVSIKKNGPLPEEWTLPHEHSMEKREKYEVLFIFFHLSSSLCKLSIPNSLIKQFM
jgi:hypothetical protein